jgi:hypothetical protein
MKVIFGKADGAAILSDERFDVTGAAAGIVELQPRAATYPDAGNLHLVELSLEPIETV